MAKIIAGSTVYKMPNGCFQVDIGFGPRSYGCDLIGDPTIFAEAKEIERNEPSRIVHVDSLAEMTINVLKAELHKHKKYLDDTDWYEIRAIRGKPAPAMILSNRDNARTRIDEIKVILGTGDEV